jgi:hypothetical protein
MKIFIWSVIVIAIAGGLLFALKSDNTTETLSPGVYDTFAQCITDSGAKFYGASWCSHCKDQKEAFGTSARLLPYVECATAGGAGQTKICEEKKITGYPTWIFKDGSQLSGKREMKELAEKTGCELPINATSTPT